MAVFENEEVKFSSISLVMDILSLGCKIGIEHPLVFMSLIQLVDR